MNLVLAPMSQIQDDGVKGTWRGKVAVIGLPLTLIRATVTAFTNAASMYNLYFSPSEQNAREWSRAYIKQRVLLLATEQ